jgi:hypothetical protein
MSVKIKNEEQARIAILESAKREEVTRVLVEQANLRQLEQQRVDSEKKLQQEEETELRIIAVQGKKNEKNRVTEINKLEQQEAIRLADNEIKIKKDKDITDRLWREKIKIQSALLEEKETATVVGARKEKDEAKAAEEAAQILAREQKENKELILENTRIAEALALQIEEKKMEVAEKTQEIKNNRLAMKIYKEKKDEDGRLVRENQLKQEEEVLKTEVIAEIADYNKKENVMPWLSR